MVGCSSEEEEDELTPKEQEEQGVVNHGSKTYQSDLDKEELNISTKKGEFEDPIPYGELLNVEGILKTGKHGYTEGEFSVEVNRVLRDESAKYRVDEEMRDLIDEKSEWVIVELFVYNWGVGDKEILTFTPQDFALYSLKGKEIPIYDVGFGTDPKRVSVYEGKPETVTVVTQVKKEEDFLVGVEKIQSEKELEIEEKEKEGEKITKEKEEAETEKEKEKREKNEDKKKKEDRKKKAQEKDKNRKDKESKEDKEVKKDEKDQYKETVKKDRDRDNVQFLSIEDAYTLTEFNIESEEVEKKGEENGKEKKEEDDKKKEEGKKDKDPEKDDEDKDKKGSGKGEDKPDKKE